MLYTGRPFGARLRGLFLIPRPGLPAALGQFCSPRAGSKEHRNINPHLRHAQGWSSGISTLAGNINPLFCILCTLGWCRSVMTMGIWLLGA